MSPPGPVKEVYKHVVERVEAVPLRVSLAADFTDRVRAAWRHRAPEFLNSLRRTWRRARQQLDRARRHGAVTRRVVNHVNEREFLARSGMLSEKAVDAIIEVSDHFVQSVSQLPHVKQVLLEGDGTGVRICTLLEAGEPDYQYYDAVFEAEAEATRDYPEVPLDFRVINRTNNPTRDFEGKPPEGVQILFQR